MAMTDLTPLEQGEAFVIETIRLDAMRAARIRETLKQFDEAVSEARAEGLHVYLAVPSNEFRRTREDGQTATGIAIQSISRSVDL